MQYDEVVATVNRLVPEMARTGDPAGTLIKHAREHSLAPAVLERMGQAYNTGTALQTMMGSDRGATAALLDLGELLDKYASWAPPEPEPVLVDPVTKRAGVPDLVGNITRGPLDLAPESEAPAKTASESDSWDELIDAYVANRYSIDDATETLHKAAHALTGMLLERGLVDREHRRNLVDLRAVEADCIRRFDDAGKTAFDWYERQLSCSWNAKCARAADEDVQAHRLVRDWSGCLSAGAAMVEAYHGFRKVAGERQELLKEAAKKDKTEKDVEQDADQRDTGGPPRGKPTRKGKVTAGGRGAPASAGGVSAQPQPPPRGAPSPPGAVPPPLPPAAQPPPLPPGPELFLRRPGEAEEPGAPVDYHIDETVEKLLGMMGRPTDVLGGQVSKWLTEQRPNRAQIGVDRGVQNVEQTHALQTLMLTDPVISKADPDQVAEIYETIRRASPDVATDRNLLRFQMREALQYGGVPPDGYKQLLEIGKLRAGNDEAARKSNKSRYNTENA